MAGNIKSDKEDEAIHKSSNNCFDHNSNRAWPENYSSKIIIDLANQANDTSKHNEKLYKCKKLEPFKEKASSSGACGVGHMRHVIALLALSGIVLANMNRQAYNQALVRMIRRPTKSDPDHNDTLPVVRPPIDGEDNHSLEKLIDSAVTESDIANETARSQTSEQSTKAVSPNDQMNNDDRYDWTSSQINLLQAAFSYGYAPLMVPGGRLSEIYGAKSVIFVSGFGSALCSLLTPVLADYSFVLLLIGRISIGVCQTGISPALYALLTRWLPPEESSIYLAMIKVGVMVGFMFGSLINSFLPWRTMFLVVGLIGLAWSLMWSICVSSQPEEHKFLSPEELQFIKKRLRQHAKEAEQNIVATKETDIDDNNDQAEREKKSSQRSKSAPWLNIITNPVVVAFTLTKFTVKLSTDTQSIQIPMYLKSVFEVSDQVNGVLNGANFAMQAVLTGFVAYTAKEMIVRGAFGMKKSGVRKLFQGINNFGMALAYLLISMNFGSLNVVCCAVLLLSFSSMFGSGGEAVLPVDLTTEYSASIMAIANCTANLSGIVLPPIVALILNNDSTSPLRWNMVWWFIGGVMTTGGIIFTCFVDARVQNFNGKRHDNESIVKGVSFIEMDQLNPTVSLTKYKNIKN